MNFSEEKFTPGTRISHYEILGFIGAGGMSSVYKARDLSLDRHVALKFQNAVATNADPEGKRFRREAEAAAALSHPNICTVHEIAEADGQRFIAMEYLEGETLDRYIVNRPLDETANVDLLLQICKGLGVAHKAGIVHRDIKPGNVFILPDRLVKLTDFGLARIVDRSRITQEGTVLGTLHYMSPEQTQGAVADFRSDIWSLGVLIYEIFAGQKPFQGDREEILIYNILHGSPPPPTTLRSRIPILVDSIVEKCLHKNPDLRYQSTDDLTVDLRRISTVDSPVHNRELAGPSPDIHRKIAAVMFTDMVGYSALMQRDERLGLAILEEQRVIVRNCVSAHRGRIVDFPGDAFFIEFESALFAVQCAIEIQNKVYLRNAAVSGGQKIIIRIGIHVGEVMVRGLNIYGDTVNIAARMEPLAEPGGICFSEEVYRYVSGKLDIPILPLGRTSLKNIDLPIEIYAIGPLGRSAEGTPVAGQGKGPVGRRLWPALTITIVAVVAVFLFLLRENRPVPLQTFPRSIAATPFSVVGGSQDRFLSVEFPAEVLKALGRDSGLVVIPISRSVFTRKEAGDTDSSFAVHIGARYVLSGVVQGIADRVNVRVLLYDALTNSIIDQKDFEHDLRELQILRDRIVTEVFTKIGADGNTFRRPPNHVRGDAYLAYLRGLSYSQYLNNSDQQRALDYLTTAHSLDTGFTAATVALAGVLVTIHERRFEERTGGLKEALALAEQVPSDNDQYAEALSVRGAVFENMKSWRMAESLYVRCYLLERGNTSNLSRLARMSLFESPDKAMGYVQELLEIDPTNDIAYNIAGAVFGQMKEYEKAKEAFQLSLKFSRGDSDLVLGNLGYVHERLGDFESAMTYYSAAIALNPRSDPGVRNCLSLLISLRRWSQADSLADLALRWDEGNGDFYYLSGVIKDGVGEKAAARKYYSLALEIFLGAEGDSLRMGFNLASASLVMARLGNREGARRNIERALLKSHDDEEVLIRAAKTFAVLGEKGSMLDAFRKAREKNVEYDYTYLMSDFEFARYLDDGELRKIAISR